MQNEEIIFGIIFTSLIIFVLITGITIVFYLARRERIKQQIMAVETRLLYEKELRKVESEVSEKLLQHVAVELHDNIAQYHTAMNVQIENLKIDYPNMTNIIAPLESYLDEVTKQIRALGRTLNSEFISKIGLIKAIEIEVPRLSALRRFKVNWSNESNHLNLTKETELLIFRSFQEIVQNALRHANASNLTITVKGNYNQFEIMIKDDGCGFDVQTLLNSNNASGVSNILKRMQLAGLDCKIQSTIGNGCEYIIKTK